MAVLNNSDELLSLLSFFLIGIVSIFWELSNNTLNHLQCFHTPLTHKKVHLFVIKVASRT